MLTSESSFMGIDHRACFPLEDVWGGSGVRTKGEVSIGVAMARPRKSSMIWRACMLAGLSVVPESCY